MSDACALSVERDALHRAAAAVAMLRLAVGGLGRVGVPVSVAHEGGDLVLRVALGLDALEDGSDAGPEIGPVLIEDAPPVAVIEAAPPVADLPGAESPDAGGGADMADAPSALEPVCLLHADADLAARLLAALADALAPADAGVCILEFTPAKAGGARTPAPEEAAPAPALDGAGDVPGIVEGQAGTPWLGAWMPAEDAQARAICRAVRDGGGTVATALRQVADALGRSTRACEARYHRRWKRPPPMVGVPRAIVVTVAPANASGCTPADASGCTPADAGVAATGPGSGPGAGFGRGRSWSAADKALLIAVAVPLLRQGESLAAMRDAAGAALGRSGLSVQCKLREDADLAKRLQVALEPARPRPPPGAGPAAVAPAPVTPQPVRLAPPVARRMPGPSRVPRVVLQERPAQVRPEAKSFPPAQAGAGVRAVSSQLDDVSADPLADHLGRVPRTGGWTPARDFALAEAACHGRTWALVAGDLGVAVVSLKARLALLQRVDPATGKPRFARAQVLGGLRGLLRRELAVAGADAGAAT